MNLSLLSPADIAADLAARAKALRLAQNMPQNALAAAAGVSLSSLKRFENTGQGSVDLMIRVAMALGASEALGAVFAQSAPRSLDDIIAPQTRRRARRP